MFPPIKHHSRLRLASALRKASGGERPSKGGFVRTISTALDPERRRRCADCCGPKRHYCRASTSTACTTSDCCNNNNNNNNNPRRRPFPTTHGGGGDGGARMWNVFGSSPPLVVARPQQRRRNITTDAAIPPAVAVTNSGDAAGDDDDDNAAPEIPGAQKGGKKLAIVFTCTVCDTRSIKQFTEHAYTKGVVIVQCPGCRNRHLIADNLGFFDDGGWNIETALRDTGEDVKVVTNDDVLELTPDELYGKDKIREATATATATAEPAGVGGASGGKP